MREIWTISSARLLHLRPLVWIAVCLYSCHCWIINNNGDMLIPRGVPLSLKSFYKSSEDFKCRDGSRTLPFSYVNDDYCDCDDGSDEPGTPACPNGIFNCLNNGYISRNIPSSRVNDGICDCCDGSDEFDTEIECSNICIELGNQAKKVAEKRREVYEIGHEFFQEYCAKGKEIKENNIAKLQRLKVSEDEAKEVKSRKEAVKVKAEDEEKAAKSAFEAYKEAAKRKAEELEAQRLEKADKLKAKKVFQELDLNHDGIITIREIQQFPKFDVGLDGSVSEDEAKFFLYMKEQMDMEEFLAKGWMVMKPLFTMNITLPSVSSQEYASNKHDIVHTGGRKAAELLGDNEDDTAKDKLVEPEYDSKTQHLIDSANEARQEFQNALEKLEIIQNEIAQLQTDIKMDFGPEEQFAILKGQCFEYDDKEYTYRLCPFDKASQVFKSGGSSIALGHWGHWVGPESNKYLKMKYENGQGCWNGPARSTIILLTCGIENKILSASEPSRCEYTFDFSTPALCSTAPDPHQHMEL